MYKKLLVSISLVLSLVTVANDNLTALANEDVTGDEIYRILLRAPEIDNNTFPVPVLYFDDLLNKKARLKATLNVPLKLEIENSRKRRLLTLFSLNGEKPIPYGQSLKPLAQIKLPSYKDVNDDTVFEQFVGPNKFIFRSLEDNKNIEYDFILPINHKHFHDGFVTVAIASTNGVELSEICEVNNTKCIQTVTFKIVPRRVVYEFNAAAFSDFYRAGDINQIFKIAEANVDLKIDVNNNHFLYKKEPELLVNRKELPFETDSPFKLLNKWRPHTISKAENKTRVINLDINPIIYYMSSDAYRASDVIIETSAVRGPDLFVKNGVKGDEILDHLKTLDPNAPRDDFGVIQNPEMPNDDASIDSVTQEEDIIQEEDITSTTEKTE